MNPLVFRPKILPTSTYVKRFLGFSSAFVLPIAAYVWAVQDPASVAEAKKRAQRRLGLS